MTAGVDSVCIGVACTDILQSTQTTSMPLESSKTLKDEWYIACCESTKPESANFGDSVQVVHWFICNTCKLLLANFINYFMITSVIKGCPTCMYVHPRP